MVPTYWLSMHVPYACRDEGACCTSGWPIPIERPQADAVRGAAGAGRLLAPAGWLRVVPGQPQDVAGVLAVGDGGGCVFHRRRQCAIQAALGHGALPSCCQHFPRDVVIDGRGVFVTLSHYCPTAADLLFQHRGPVDIVAGPAAVPGGAAEGLDARDTLPPLLTRDVLMDLAGLTAWEGHVVSWLGGWNNPDGRCGPEPALALLDSHARQLSSWRPGGATIAGAIACLGGEPGGAAEPGWDDERRLREVCRDALPLACTWPEDPADLHGSWDRLRAGWQAHAGVINRFLAAHAFASWTAYQGDGVIAGVRRLRVTLAVLRAEVARTCPTDGSALDRAALTTAIRQTDLLLMHLVDRQALNSAITGP